MLQFNSTLISYTWREKRKQFWIQMKPDVNSTEAIQYDVAVYVYLPWMTQKCECSISQDCVNLL